MKTKMPLPREWVKKLIKELEKHASRDDCYDCKQLLRAMGLDPDLLPKDAKN